MTWRCQQGCVPSANRKKRELEEDTVGPYIIKRGPIKIAQGKSQNENGGESRSFTKLNRPKKKCVYMDKGKGKRSPRYEVKGSPDTKIYKLKEILKNSIRVKVSSLTTTLFCEGSRKINHT